MSLKLMYITNDVKIAQIAEKNGVDRIWIDLEQLGKEERQKNINTVKSRHLISDIKKIKPFLKESELLVRINPWNSNSIEEIDKVIEAGADIVMLPMWKTYREVINFLNAINGRVKTILLLETKEAVNCIDNILSLNFDEIHIGLNDLHLSYGLTFMFELLSNGIVEQLCDKFKARKIPFGFGGIAKIGEGLLPAEKIIMEHYRLGSTRVILSRSFCDNEFIEDYQEFENIFCKNIFLLRKFEYSLNNISINILEENRLEVQKCIHEIVNTIKIRRNNFVL
ncbi:MAG: aldolase/citrate lyase family protein [Pleomorphochaeta sp.]